MQNYVERLGQALAARIENAPCPYFFTIYGERTSSRNLMEPVPLPGGYILIPLELWHRAATESEFAAIVAHSMIHIAHRHGTRMATRGQIVNLSTVPLVFSWPVSADVNTPVPLGFVSLWRPFEIDADTAAVPVLSRAGFDPSALAAFIQTLPEPGSPMKSPFPPRATRLEAIAKAIAELPARTYLPATEEFRSLQTLVQQ